MTADLVSVAGLRNTCHNLGKYIASEKIYNLIFAFSHRDVSLEAIIGLVIFDSCRFKILILLLFTVSGDSGSDITTIACPTPPSVTDTAFLLMIPGPIFDIFHHKI